MKRILVLSQNAAKKLDLDCTHAVISIRDPHDEFKFPVRWGRRGVLPLYFTDLEKPDSLDTVIKFNMMTTDHARQAWEFIEQHRDVDTLVIHCWAGKSRSTGMAEAIARCIGPIKVEMTDQATPNIHVRDTMIIEFARLATLPRNPDMVSEMMIDAMTDEW